MINIFRMRIMIEASGGDARSGRAARTRCRVRGHGHDQVRSGPRISFMAGWKSKGFKVPNSDTPHLAPWVWDGRRQRGGAQDGQGGQVLEFSLATLSRLLDGWGPGYRVLGACWAFVWAAVIHFSKSGRAVGHGVVVFYGS